MRRVIALTFLLSVAFGQEGEEGEAELEGEGEAEAEGEEGATSTPCEPEDEECNAAEAEATLEPEIIIPRVGFEGLTELATEDDARDVPDLEQDQEGIRDCDGMFWTDSMCQFRQYKSCEDWSRDHICDYGQRFTMAMGVRGSPNFNCPRFEFDNGDCLCGRSNIEYMFIDIDQLEALEEEFDREQLLRDEEIGLTEPTVRIEYNTADLEVYGYANAMWAGRNNQDEEEPYPWTNRDAFILYQKYWATKNDFGENSGPDKTMTCDGYCLSDWACTLTPENNHGQANRPGITVCRATREQQLCVDEDGVAVQECDPQNPIIGWTNNGAVGENRCDYGERYSDNSITMNWDCHVWWYPNLKLMYRHDAQFALDASGGNTGWEEPACSPWDFKEKAEQEEDSIMDHMQPGDSGISTYGEDMPEVMEGICEPHRNRNCVTKRLDDDVYNAVVEQIQNCPIASEPDNEQSCVCRQEEGCVGEPQEQVCNQRLTRSQCHGVCSQENDETAFPAGDCVSGVKPEGERLCRWEDRRVEDNAYCTPKASSADGAEGTGSVAANCYEDQDGKREPLACNSDAEQGGVGETCRWHVRQSDWMHLVYMVVDDPLLLPHLQEDLNQLSLSFENFWNDMRWRTSEEVEGPEGTTTVERNHDDVLKFRIGLNLDGDRVGLNLPRVADGRRQIFDDWWLHVGSRTGGGVTERILPGQYEISHAGNTWWWDRKRSGRVDPVVKLRNFLYDQLEGSATNYSLTFWAHGSGWYIGEVSSNDSSGLTVKQIAEAIDSAVSDTDKDDEAFDNLPSGEECQRYDEGSRECFKFDIIGFDACRMGTMANLSALKKRARFVVASEELEPIDGWEWDQMLPITDDGERVGVFGEDDEAITSYLNQIMERYVTKDVSTQGQRTWLTLTVFDMNMYHSFEELFHQLLDSITTALNASDQQMINLMMRMNRDRTYRMASNEDVDYRNEAGASTYDNLKKGAIQFYDVKGFLDQLVEEFLQSNTGFGDCAGIVTALRETTAAYRELVVLHRNGSAGARYNGLSFYWPFRPVFWATDTTTEASRRRMQRVTGARPSTPGSRQRRRGINDIPFIETTWGNREDNEYWANSPTDQSNPPVARNYLFIHATNCTPYCKDFGEEGPFGSASEADRDALNDFYSHCAIRDEELGTVVNQSPIISTEECANVQNGEFYYCDATANSFRDCGRRDPETGEYTDSACNMYRIEVGEGQEAIHANVDTRRNRAAIFVDEKTISVGLSVGIVPHYTDGETIYVMDKVAHVFESRKREIPPGEDTLALEYAKIELPINYPTLGAANFMPLHTTYMRNPQSCEYSGLEKTCEDAAYEVSFAVDDADHNDGDLDFSAWKRGRLGFSAGSRDQVGGNSVLPTFVDKNDKPVLGDGFLEPRTQARVNFVQCSASRTDFIEDNYDCTSMRSSDAGGNLDFLSRVATLEVRQEMNPETGNMDIIPGTLDLRGTSDYYLTMRDAAEVFIWVTTVDSYSRVNDYCFYINDPGASSPTMVACSQAPTGQPAPGPSPTTETPAATTARPTPSGGLSGDPCPVNQGSKKGCQAVGICSYARGSGACTLNADASADECTFDSNGRLVGVDDGAASCKRHGQRSVSDGVSCMAVGLSKKKLRLDAIRVGGEEVTNEMALAWAPSDDAPVEVEWNGLTYQVTQAPVEKKGNLSVQIVMSPICRTVPHVCAARVRSNCFTAGPIKESTAIVSANVGQFCAWDDDASTCEVTDVVPTCAAYAESKLCKMLAKDSWGPLCQYNKKAAVACVGLDEELVVCKSLRGDACDGQPLCRRASSGKCVNATRRRMAEMEDDDELEDWEWDLEEEP